MEQGVGGWLGVRARIGLGALAAGALGAVAFVPWLAKGYTGAYAGIGCGWGLAVVGYAIALPIWAIAGRWVTDDRRPASLVAAAVTGALAAGLCADLVWLPAVELWATGGLWRAVAAEETGGEIVAAVLRDVVHDLAAFAIPGVWVHLALGAAAGALGAWVGRTATAPADPSIPSSDLVWPLVAGRWAVALAMMAVMVVAQMAEHVPLLQTLVAVDAGLVGAVTAALLVAVGVRAARSPVWGYRLLALAYAVGALISVAVWLGFPALANAGLFGDVGVVGYLGLPAVGAGLGLWLGLRATVPPRPEWRDLLGESLLSALALVVLAGGPGLGSLALATASLPIPFIAALDGKEAFPEVAPVVVSMLTWHWKLLGAGLVGGVTAPLALGVPVLAVLRWAVPSGLTGRGTPA